MHAERSSFLHNVSKIVSAVSLVWGLRLYQLYVQVIATLTGNRPGPDGTTWASLQRVGFPPRLTPKVKRVRRNVLIWLLASPILVWSLVYVLKPIDGSGPILLPLLLLLIIVEITGYSIALEHVIFLAVPMWKLWFNVALWIAGVAALVTSGGLFTFAILVLAFTSILSLSWPFLLSNHTSGPEYRRLRRRASNLLDTLLRMAQDEARTSDEVNEIYERSDDLKAILRNTTLPLSLMQEAVEYIETYIDLNASVGTTLGSNW
jgi:hypothetical protein